MNEYIYKNQNGRLGIEQGKKYFNLYMPDHVHKIVENLNLFQRMSEERKAELTAAEARIKELETALINLKVCKIECFYCDGTGCDSEGDDCVRCGGYGFNVGGDIREYVLDIEKLLAKGSPK